MATDSATRADPVIFKPRRTCRACGEKELRPILLLGEQYLPRFIGPSEDRALLPRAPLSLVRCDGCGLLQLKDTVDPDLLFKEFWYRSSVNATMRADLLDVVNHGLAYQSGGTWLDIGANDGYLLSLVGPKFERIAVEPALNFAEELKAHSDLVISDYFRAHSDLANRCDVISSIAMFYDLDDPGSFIEAIRSSLTKDGIWINQLNDSPTMMRANAFDSICHEHLCYYDVATLNKLYVDHGMKIISLRYNRVNGGSIRVIAAKATSRDFQADTHGHPVVTAQEAWDFARRISKWKEQMKRLLLLYGGSIWCYGASTKGMVLLQYLEADWPFLAVADLNPKKHGLLMAGSWTPIKSEEEMRAAKPLAMLMLPWSFKREFNVREAETRKNGTTLIYPLPNIELVV
jgi:hypothetical protein